MQDLKQEKRDAMVSFKTERVNVVLGLIKHELNDKDLNIHYVINLINNSMTEVNRLQTEIDLLGRL